MLIGQPQEFPHRYVGGDDHRVFQDAGLEALDLGDFGGLLLRREVLVDDPNPSLLRQGNRQTGFGDRVHRRRNQGDVQCDVAGQPGFERRIARQNCRMRGDEQKVVEGVGFGDQPHEMHSL